MGIQRHSQKSGASGKLSASKPAKEAGQAGSIWNRLPQFLNMARYRMQSAQQANQLDYEPLHLHITPSEVHPIIAAVAEQEKRNGCTSLNTDNLLVLKPTVRPISKNLSLENFIFLLEQVPLVQTVQFSGRNDPFQNDALLKMVDYAHTFNGAKSTITTQGTLLRPYIDAILQSHLQSLVIELISHRPSSYARISGLPLQQFVTIRDNVTHLMERKRALKSKVEIVLRMSVDVHNYREIPDMLRFAESLGVDGIQFDNTLSNELLPESQTASDRALYADDQPVVHFLKKITNTTLRQIRMNVILPVLLKRDMSAFRNCKEPYNTVSVDADLNIAGCSRQVFYRTPLSKVWDMDFWNNSTYQWLRSVHQSGQPSLSRPEVPQACQGCPRNLSCQP